MTSPADFRALFTLYEEARDHSPKASAVVKGLRAMIDKGSLDQLEGLHTVLGPALMDASLAKPEASAEKTMREKAAFQAGFDGGLKRASSVLSDDEAVKRLVVTSFAIGAKAGFESAADVCDGTNDKGDPLKGWECAELLRKMEAPEVVGVAVDAIREQANHGTMH